MDYGAPLAAISDFPQLGQNEPVELAPQIGAIQTNLQAAILSAIRQGTQLTALWFHSKVVKVHVFLAGICESKSLFDQIGGRPYARFVAIAFSADVVQV
jgi:hypothetical protein